MYSLAGWLKRLCCTSQEADHWTRRGQSVVQSWWWSSSSLDSRTSACFTVPVPITWRNKAAWAGSTDELSVCDGCVNILNVSLDIASFLEMFVADRTVKGLGPNFNYISIFLFILLIWLQLKIIITLHCAKLRLWNKFNTKYFEKQRAIKNINITGPWPSLRGQGKEQMVL